jgi:hypothetical protein
MDLSVAHSAGRRGCLVSMLAPALILLCGICASACANGFHLLRSPGSTDDQSTPPPPVSTPIPVGQPGPAIGFTGPKEVLAEHCHQLASATPGVEELRIRNGVVESRQWMLIEHDSAPRWSVSRPKNSTADGWAPKPNLAKLNFTPPLQPVLKNNPREFLAYAATQSDNYDDTQKIVTMNEVFGGIQGKFSWRGKEYGYAMSPELPCFPLP